MEGVQKGVQPLDCIKMVVAMNPCECGWHGRPSGHCIDLICSLIHRIWPVPLYCRYSRHCRYPCWDGLSSVTKQVKKYRNRLKIRDSESSSTFGSLPESLFSCFNNSVIVCLLTGWDKKLLFWVVETIGLLSGKSPFFSTDDLILLYCPGQQTDWL